MGKYLFIYLEWVLRSEIARSFIEYVYVKIWYIIFCCVSNILHFLNKNDCSLGSNPISPLKWYFSFSFFLIEVTFIYNSMFNLCIIFWILFTLQCAYPQSRFICDHTVDSLPLCSLHLCICFCLIWLVHLSIYLFYCFTYEWNHTGFVFLHLMYFIYCNTLKVHPCSGK